ncbi:hypothetical protein [Croceicoccus marinus]|uniref:Uncharacterized protein n=1 Tax=Croceicoccus marinus TaxID=450378 RepID=A0A7G6VV59_9SPHN|nr:hypothetical protein [Croceicoccus marinus]QNE05624.1 hypothetical protein H4O24_02715 [Croceicoccus marinus]
MLTFVNPLFNRMPVASPPIPERTPAPLRDGEREFIKEAVERFYGPDAIVRNYGPDADRLELHVETDEEMDMRKYDCLGVLLTRVDRRDISLEVTKRGTKIRGNAKLAYRQGVIL